MHELSIALTLVETADEAAREAAAQRVTGIHVRVGVLSGVVTDALLFSFDVAAKGTLLDGAKLTIDEVPAVVHCPTCNADVELANIQRFRCPVCDTPTADLVQGRELELTSVEIQVAE